MKKIPPITLLAITAALASCSKKIDVKSAGLGGYKTIFSPKAY